MAALGRCFLRQHYVGGRLLRRRVHVHCSLPGKPCEECSKHSLSRRLPHQHEKARELRCIAASSFRQRQSAAPGPASLPAAGTAGGTRALIGRAGSGADPCLRRAAERETAEWRVERERDRARDYRIFSIPDSRRQACSDERRGSTTIHARSQNTGLDALALDRRRRFLKAKV